MKNYVLVSVSDKTNIIPLVDFLYQKGYTILSTGGTFKAIYNNLEGVRDRLIQVSDFTGFEEILGGRVKTLHPKIYGGLLWDEKFDCEGITKIDMVVVNLYPFKEVIGKDDTTEEMAIENIDIGGVSLIRAAAKNFKNVILIVDPNDYQNIMENWEETNSYLDRKELAIKGFNMVTEYDACITNYFDSNITFRRYQKQKSLKYGCNPYQDNAAIYTMDDNQIPFKVLNGNPGYINLLDAINSWLLVVEVEKTIGKTAASSFKHTSPAGVAISNGKISDIEKKIYDIESYDLSNSPTAEAFIKARNADPLSSFGDFISISGIVDEICARLISREVSDGIIARGYTPEALEILKKKKKGNYIILEGLYNYQYKDLEFREIMGFTLSQKANNMFLSNDDFKNIVSKQKTRENWEEIKNDLILATITLKYTPSNSISFAQDGVVIGVGAGQQNRVDCIKLAGRKSLVWRLRRHPKVLELYYNFKEGLKRQEKTNAITKYINGDFSEVEYEQWKCLFNNDIPLLTQEEKESFLKENDDPVSLSSDAFMPFRDNIDNAVKFNVKNIIQPGGSVSDESVIEACDEYGMLMVMTGKRFFLH
jgi:phosphoribosylaminoimidazolecarboxamide formyltransferase / IMP cyclohydrolase